MSSLNNGRKPWSGPVDMNQINTESITILQYWDITTPPPAKAKLSKFRPNKRHRRISLEMHRMPRTENGLRSLELADVFNDDDDDMESDSSNHLTYNKAYFRISKFVPIKNASGGQDQHSLSTSFGERGERGRGGDDTSTVVSDVSARTKDFFSKPDHEWRTKFLLQVSRVAITQIKNEKEVFFEAWNNGEVIERSLVFQTVDQAKEFSYDLERLANEDPDINEDGGGTFIAPQNMIIKTPSKQEPSTNEGQTGDEPLENMSDRRRGDGDGDGTNAPNSLLTSTTQSGDEDIETGRSRSTNMNQPSSALSSSANAANAKGRCHSFTFILTNILHLLGTFLSLSGLFYTVAIFSYTPDPLITAGIMVLSWSSFIALTHGSGILGIHQICIGGSFCISLSIGLGILSILFHASLIILIDVREYEMFAFLKTNYEKLFLTEDVVRDMYADLSTVYIVVTVWCILDFIR